MELDTSFRDTKFALTRGIVTAVPDSLHYNRDSPGSMPWKTNMELRVGDEVVYYFLSYVNAMSKQRNKRYEIEGETHILVKYEHIYVYKRGDELKPINGYVLVRPVDVAKGDFDLPAKYGGHEKFLGLVEYVGDRITEYKEKTYDPDPDVELNRGDLVILDRACNTPIQYPGMQTLEGDSIFFRVQRQHILGRVA